MNCVYTIVVMLSLFVSVIFASVDEDELFSDSVTVVENTLSSEAVQGIDEVASTSFSGELVSDMTVRLTPAWFDTPSQSEALLSNATVANLLLDIRLPGAIKAFADAEVQFSPASYQSQFFVNELFIDANIQKQVYFRLGKQVLQWGRCSIWNPNDLINVEGKNLFNELGRREGAYGMKMHVPFGTKANIYGFIDSKGSSTIDAPAAALKFEYLLKGVEIGVAVWDKKGNSPVYGGDFSMDIFGVATVGEISLRNSTDRMVMIERNDTLFSMPGKNQLSPRIALGFTKALNVMDVTDRVSATLEFFYNHDGYSGKVVGTPATYAFGESGTSGTKIDFLLKNDLFEMMAYSKNYAALSMYVQRFIIQDVTLFSTVIGNINQSSAIVSGGLTYRNLHNFSLSLIINGAIADDGTEFALKGNQLSTSLRAGVAF